MTAPFSQFLEDFQKEQDKIGHHQPHNTLLASHMVRRNHLKRLFEYRKRNVIAYYSGWLHRAGASSISVIADRDFKPFSSTLERLDTSIGLDLVLHTTWRRSCCYGKTCQFFAGKVRLRHRSLRATIGNVCWHNDCLCGKTYPHGDRIKFRSH